MARFEPVMSGPIVAALAVHLVARAAGSLEHGPPVHEAGAIERDLVQEAAVPGVGPFLGGALLDRSPDFGKPDAHDAPQLPRDVGRHVALGDDVGRQRFGEHAAVPAARGQRLNRLGLLDAAERLEPRDEQLSQPFIVERRDRRGWHRREASRSSRAARSSGTSSGRRWAASVCRALRRSSMGTVRRSHGREVSPGRLGVTELRRPLLPRAARYAHRTIASAARALASTRKER